MKYTCMRCERTSPANSLFCHDLDCPAERSPVVLAGGDRVGDIEVLKPVVHLRSSIIYAAQQQNLPVLMKVAHPGAAHRDRLIREATFLRTLRADKKPYPTLPRIRAPYSTTTLEQDVLGTTMVGTELLHYTLFDYLDGQPLHDLLLQRPQWWVNHVGWLCTELASTINTLHLQGLYHFGLTPGSVLVRFDKRQLAPHLVLCDLGIASSPSGLAAAWYPDYVPPAHLAPELLSTAPEGAPVGVHTDVYGLGLIMYEMLVGRPVYVRPLEGDGPAREAVRHDARVGMSRVEDVSPVAEIALHAAAADPSLRQPTAADLVEELTAVVGPIPVTASRPLPPLNLLLVLGAAALVMVFLVSLGISLSSGPP